MHTTTTSTHPTTQLDLVRGDAAARQRRAATYRFVHEQRPSPRSTHRVSALTALAAALLALGLVGGSPAIAGTSDSPLPHGYEAGHADGWYAPGSTGGTFSTAETSVRSASTTLPHGYEVGRPDGWYEPGTPGMKVAGASTSQAPADDTAAGQHPLVFCAARGPGPILAAGPCLEVTTADLSSGPMSTPLPHGYEVGRPDGWYEPGTPGVEVAGVSITRTPTGTVPPNVR